MRGLGPHLLERCLERENAIGRRSFLENCGGVVAGAMAAQNSPALAQALTSNPSNFFPGFRRQTVQTSGTSINVVVGGNGPPLLLLHVYPQTPVNCPKIPPE